MSGLSLRRSRPPVPERSSESSHPQSYPVRPCDFVMRGTVRVSFPVLEQMHLVPGDTLIFEAALDISPKRSAYTVKRHER